MSYLNKENYPYMPITHFFVLMLENRSFDHVFGFSPIAGTDAVTGHPTTIDRPDPAVNINTDTQTNPANPTAFPVHNGADFSFEGIDLDPGHEFPDVQQQLTGPNLGFVDNYASQKTTNPDRKTANPGRVMDCFSPTQLPVLNQLAAEFAICDHWHSSLPGPTWPNRFFMMAATSGGLTKSPTTADIIKATALKGYDFEHGNIFDALDKKGAPWCIVEGDDFPVSFALKGMDANDAKGRFVAMADFAAKLAQPGFNEQFIWIEPMYGSHKFDVTGPGDFSGGNSMHPLDDVRKGELLVKQVYEAIRAVPAVWEKSAMLIVFDEHGGFYDHLTPPATTPPGDNPINAAPDQTPFGFDRLGVRVPAIVISPLIPKGLIDHTIYDHTSALATLEKQQGMSPLTHRDQNAEDFRHLFSLATARTDTPPVLVNPAAAEIALAESLAAKPLDTAETLKDDLAKLETIPAAALATDATAALATDATTAQPVSGPQVGFAYVGLMRALSKASTAQEKTAWKKEFTEIHTPKDAARFMTRAKLKVRFGEYAPPILISPNSDN
jgi:phospholipase C